MRNLTSPDPAQGVLIDNVQIVNRTLYLVPNADNTMAQTANAILFRPFGFTTLRQAEPSLLRIELWSRPRPNESARLLSVVSEFDPAAIQPGQLSPGSILALTPSVDASLTLTSA